MFAVRLAKRPWTAIAGIAVLLAVCVLTVVFPDNAHAAPASTVSSVKADVTDDYLPVVVDVTRIYKPRINRAAKVKFTNPNPNNDVRIKFQDEHFKRLPKAFVPAGSTIVLKFKLYELYYGISVITADGNKLPYQGGNLNLKRAD